MSAAMWEQLDDEEPGRVALPGRAAPVLVSLQFINGVLRRRRHTLVVYALVGLLLGGAFLALVPATYTASASLALAHDPSQDPSAAMATDVSLATTRAVAKLTIHKLSLQETPSSLLKTVTAIPTTSDVLTLTLKADSDSEAVRRLAAYTSSYLSFRASQLTSQSDLLRSGTTKRIETLTAKAQDLTDQIDKLASKNRSGSNAVNELITQRAQIVGEVSTLQETVQDAAVQTTSIVAASRIIDTAAVDPGRGLRRIVLVLATAMVALTAMGSGFVLFREIVSDKLHRRIEVATALGVPVTTSVGQVLPISKWIAWMPGLRSVNQRRAGDLQRLAGAIKMAIPDKGDGQWLAVGCIDNSEDVALGVILAAAELQRSGRIVRVVDMTEEGLAGIVLEAVRGSGSDLRLAISRPKTPPSLARDVSDIVTYGPETRDIPALGETDVFLTVADLDPAVGAFHLSAWTNRVVVAVTAGLSSAERVRTAAELVRSASLELHGGILIRSDRRDGSSVNPLGISEETDSPDASWR